MYDIFIILLLVLILLTLLIISALTYYRVIHNNEFKQHSFIQGKTITVKQLFNKKQKLMATVNTFLTLDEYITYINWEYIYASNHSLTFQLSNVNGLYIENSSGKVVVLVDGYTTIAQYSTIYNKESDKITVSIVDKNNKIINTSGKISIKLVIRNN